MSLVHIDTHRQLDLHPIKEYVQNADDKLEQQHCLFTHYKDPCRQGPGEDKSWAIGKMECCGPEMGQMSLS
ncbi:Sphingomyelin phosphodiesterase 3, partial [Ophiophagus hannah]